MYSISTAPRSVVESPPQATQQSATFYHHRRGGAGPRTVSEGRMRRKHYGRDLSYGVNVPIRSRHTVVVHICIYARLGGRGGRPGLGATRKDRQTCTYIHGAGLVLPLCPTRTHCPETYYRPCAVYQPALPTRPYPRTWNDHCDYTRAHAVASHAGTANRKI